ncbi:MAG: S41 family peptidase [Pseudomonadota bacterium]
MRRVFILGVCATLTALAGCGGGGGDGGLVAPGPVAGTDACSIDGQKQFVLDAMRDVYFWNDLLPANVDLDQYATPEDVLAFLTSFQPLDSFSFITTVAADNALFGSGEFGGFGFSYRFENNQARFSRVFSGSPAALAGFERGHEIIAIEGQTVASLGPSGLANAFGPSEIGVTRTFRNRRLDGTEYEVAVTKDTVTIDPIPQYRLISTAGGDVGYLEFSSFVSTAEGELSAAFADFNAANITDLVLDLRYNGGGLVSIADLLGDYLGSAVAPSQVFSRTLFNANNSASNSTELFEQRANSPSLARLVVIASGATASASELVINSMEPHVEVVIVGDDTFGKPVGQVGIDFCDNRMRPTAFETVNSLGQGQYFDGLPVDCPAPDDLDQPVGGPTDPALVTALEYLQNGACPPVTTVTSKPDRSEAAREPLRNDLAYREFNAI